MKEVKFMFSKLFGNWKCYPSYQSHKHCVSTGCLLFPGMRIGNQRVTSGSSEFTPTNFPSRIGASVWDIAKEVAD